ncbi:MAG: c-type cytochrome [Myxococcaceae bacterium]
MSPRTQLKVRALALLMLFSLRAEASSAAFGESVYRARCASCHDAKAANERRARQAILSARVAPNLGEAKITQDSKRLRAWIANPWALNAKTACDTRGLSGTQQEDLLAFVLSKSKPVPAPEQERLQKDLERALALRGQRAPAPSGPVLQGGSKAPPAKHTSKRSASKRRGAR